MRENSNLGEGEISWTMYTSATSTVWFVALTNGGLGKVKHLWNEIKNNKNLFLLPLGIFIMLKMGEVYSPSLNVESPV